jgi:hypothetical protein
MPLAYSTIDGDKPVASAESQTASGNAADTGAVFGIATDGTTDCGGAVSLTRTALHTIQVGL